MMTPRDERDAEEGAAEVVSDHRPLPRPTRMDELEEGDLDFEAEAIVWADLTPEQRRRRYEDMWASYLCLGGVLSSRDVAPSSLQEGQALDPGADSPRSRPRLVRRFGV